MSDRGKLDQKSDCVQAIVIADNFENDFTPICSNLPLVVFNMCECVTFSTTVFSGSLTTREQAVN